MLISSPFEVMEKNHPAYRDENFESKQLSSSSNKPKEKRKKLDISRTSIYENVNHQTLM